MKKMKDTATKKELDKIIIPGLSRGNTMKIDRRADKYKKIGR